MGFLDGIKKLIGQEKDVTSILIPPSPQFPFLQEILQAVANSNREPQTIYPLLQANLDKLSPKLSLALHEWGNATLPKIPPEQAEGVAKIINSFSNLLLQFPFGNRSDNLEIAIAGYQTILKNICTRSSMPLKWAGAMMNLGTAYRNRIQGTRKDNLEQSIYCYQQSLEIKTRSAMPQDWADVMNNLGNTYLFRIQGTRADNLEHAIQCYTQALEVRTRTTMPLEWAQTIVNLGNAYYSRIQGLKADNLEHAIYCYQQSLDVFTRQSKPIEWATAMMNLGSIYSERIQGARANNLEQSIRCSHQALDVMTRAVMPRDWADIMNNLGTAYFKRIQGSRMDNLEQAIYCFMQALEIFTFYTTPIEWARTMNNLGEAYRERIQGARVENLEQAINYYEQALQVRTHTAMPIDWAETMTNLGNAYAQRIQGTRADNLEQAIHCYKQALDVRSRPTMPLDWAITMLNLGTAYAYRIQGTRADNLEQAIHCYEQVLQVKTRTAIPIDWANTMNSMGNAYLYRIRGARTNNLEHAIHCYEQAKQVRTRTAMPIDWAKTMNNLGNAYYQRIQGTRTDNLKQAIHCFVQALEVFTSNTLPYEYRNVAIGLGWSLVETQQYDRAIETLGLAMQADQTLYQVSVSRVSKESTIAEARDLYALAAWATLHAGTLSDAVVLLERGRARMLGETLARDRANLAGVEQHDAELAAAYVQATQKIQALEQQGRLHSDTTHAADATPDVRASLVAESEAAINELGQAIERIRTIPGYEDFLKPPAWETIARSVIVGCPLVYLLTTRTGSLVLVLHRATEQSDVDITQIISNDFTQEKLHDILVQYKGEGEKRQVIGGYLPGQLVDTKFLRDALATLSSSIGHYVLAPLADHLRYLKASQGVLIPTGMLGLLPLHTIAYPVAADTAPDTNAPLAPPSHRCLIDEVSVIFAPSAQVLEHIRQEAEQRRTDTHYLVGVGNPLPSHQPLLYARAELESIANLLPPHQQTTLYEQAATADALWEALPRATIAHLSCHGRFDFDEPLESALALAQDSRLTLGEMLEADNRQQFAQVQLAVLSACQTAVTDFQNIPDEAVGLFSGFVQAGIPAVVGTLWSVSAASTALLLNRLYEYYLNEDQHPAVALRQAQCWLRDLTNERLLEYLDAHQPLRQAEEETMETMETMMHIVSKLSPVIVQELRASVRGALGVGDGQKCRYAAPYYWAGFVYYGAPITNGTGLVADTPIGRVGRA